MQRNYHVILGEDKHQYSVPYQYIGQQTHLLDTATDVEIDCGIERIALRQRDGLNQADATLPSHLPEQHRQYAEQRGWDANYFRKQASRIGPDTLLGHRADPWQQTVD